MAKTQVRAESAQVIRPNQFPPAAAALIAARMLNLYSPREIANAVEMLMDLLDLMGGDPDLEDNGDDEPAGDERDCAWIEWHSMRASWRDGRNFTITDCEDDEYDDPKEDDDPSGQCDEDEVNTAYPAGIGPGCAIADEGLVL